MNLIRLLMKFFSLFITFFFSYTLLAQVINANWKAHFAYNDFVDVTSSSERVYVAASSSVFAYNLNTQSTEEYTTVEGLSGEDISALFYAEKFSTLIIGYGNGLVQMLNESTGKISSFVDIQNQTNIISTPLTINNFFFDEEQDELYIATGFGIVVFNISTSLFGDTYFISDSQSVLSNVLAVGLSGDQILASISGRGIFAANKNAGSALLSFSEWTNVQTDVFNEIVQADDQLIAVDGSENLYSFNNLIFETVYTNEEIISNVKVNEETITLTHGSGSTVLDSNFSQVNSFQYPTINEEVIPVSTSIFVDSELFFDIDGEGFYKTQNQNFNDQVKISLDGPAYNNAYKLDVYEGQLWIAYGNSNVFFNDFAGSTPGLRAADIDHYNATENTWQNIPFEDFNVRSLQNVVINKENPSEIYFSSYRGGLLKYNGSTFLLFDETNSNLEKDGGEFIGFSEELTETLELTKTYFTTFDQNNNIWTVNSRQKNTIKQFSTEGEGISINFENIFTIPEGRFDFYNFEEFVFNESDDIIYIASVFTGLIGINLNPQISVVINDLEIQNMPSSTVKTVTLDKNGELWFGTISGIRRITSPEIMFQNSGIQAESIIFEQDGIARELLFEQTITDIKVDSNNNKWIGTLEGGVFYVSEDGQETIYNFTTSNSPLPSNIVADIAIDESTGAVFIATEKGLIEFNSNITAANNDLTNLKVFPNPVRPEYGEVNVTIQGLTSGANVKITDIEGNLVYEAQNETFDDGGSGTILWNTKNFNGNKVATGVYLLLVTAEDMVETKVEKLLIVR